MIQNGVRTPTPTRMLPLARLPKKMMNPVKPPARNSEPN
jgi:hypothetical protein